LKGIIDIWSGALPKHRLALSYSYDPDGPKELYEGNTEKLDEHSTEHYAEYLRYSAFDYALTKENITYRRDGCGGAVHSNERKLNDEAFRLGRGPMFSEFMDGYTQSKSGGDKWLAWKIDDALSLHPNYINLLGWQGSDSLTFIKERSDLFNLALARMGYRLVPTRVKFPANVLLGTPFQIESRWINRGVGRALRDYELRLSFVTADGQVAATASGGLIQSSKWTSGQEYDASDKATLTELPAGSYEIAIGLHDKISHRAIELPLAGGGPAGRYRIGHIQVADSKGL
jgi:hypothetical protein